MSTVLRADHVTKTYGSRSNARTALDDISFQITEGEFVGIMGPSGSGKTTLLNLVATIDEPTSGHIFIDGDPILGMKEAKLASFRREKLGFIFQDFNLLDTLTLRENIALPLALAAVKAEELEQRTHSVADTLGLAELLDKYPYEVSGGQKQRAAAARAMITHPKLILADEPTGALDSRSATELLECLMGMNKQQQATIMMVTHDPFAASYCQRILFLKDGRWFTELVKRGSRQDFYQKIIDTLSVMGGGKDEHL
ncbi:bacitracin ABC transporter ATP-binding protein [Ammoniphilus oxalaticus]|uniref:Bacitracin ABC transporter ATP-binding protein n=1 Tax=Ammoniphilus oxalaticus TaxID=66863 RepID=A0A419SKJ3_9BACL|nr:ABC transporter ATP-binding protein [Ammoniphilus oxalaticus]RKD24531.1 bacitracin ABC transporter ATP-binding protein [Ammoniphilus oxalaticus]